MSNLTTPVYVGRKAHIIPFDEYNWERDEDGRLLLIGGYYSQTGHIEQEEFDSLTARDEGYAGKKSHVYMIVRSVANGIDYLISAAALQATMKLTGTGVDAVFYDGVKLGQKLNDHGHPWVSAYVYFDKKAESQIP